MLENDMRARSLAKTSPSPDLGQTDSEDFGQQLLDLNRRITATIVAELAAGTLSPELVAIIEKRDALRTRIERLEGTRNG
jgi:hypothetical protein